MSLTFTHRPSDMLMTVSKGFTPTPATSVQRPPIFQAPVTDVHTSSQSRSSQSSSSTELHVCRTAAVFISWLAATRTRTVARAFRSRRGESSNEAAWLGTSRASKPRVSAAAVASVPAPHPSFKLDVSQFTSEDAKQRHLGACGGPPEVEIVSTGSESDVVAARGTLRIRYPARKTFENLCDPEENTRIFDRNLASVNFRRLLEEDEAAQTRLFETSKTGRWSLLGIPFNFESTVLAMEDWRKLEIRFRLRKEGAMKHMSGFWRTVPVSQDESIVLFYNEAIPSIPIPRIFRSFAGRIIQEMAGSLLEDVRQASLRWIAKDAADAVKQAEIQ